MRVLPPLYTFVRALRQMSRVVETDASVKPGVESLHRIAA